MGLSQKSRSAGYPVVFPCSPLQPRLDVYGLAAPAEGALPERGGRVCTTELAALSRLGSVQRTCLPTLPFLPSASSAPPRKKCISVTPSAHTRISTSPSKPHHCLDPILLSSLSWGFLIIHYLVFFYFNSADARMGLLQRHYTSKLEGRLEKPTYVLVSRHCSKGFA